MRTSHSKQVSEQLLIKFTCIQNCSSVLFLTKYIWIAYTPALISIFSFTSHPAKMAARLLLAFALSGLSTAGSAFSREPLGCCCSRQGNSNYCSAFADFGCGIEAKCHPLRARCEIAAADWSTAAPGCCCSRIPSVVVLHSFAWKRGS